jgi:sterol desaturase/sphingolipid hydroxylase (fatty acid hydroxylase superfamily)
MPTPIEILLDPVSLGVLALYGAMMLVEALAPGRALPRIRGWLPRALASFAVYFYLSSYLPLLWDGYLARYQLLDLSGLGPIAGATVGLFVYEGLVYAWHRAMHESDWLFRTFHQMHHSVGLSPEAVTLFLFATLFLGIFQHMNVRTPRWLGYFIQRPESHTIHHGKGLHRRNYSDLPVFDMVFGTFRNPAGFEMDTGYYDGASARVVDMLLCRDISSKEEILRKSISVEKAA